MKKRTLALILSICMCVGLLAGCGDSGEKEPDNAETPGTSQPAETPDVEVGDKGDTEAVKSDTYLRDLVTVSASTDGGTFNPYARGGGLGSNQLGIFQKLGYEDSTGAFRLCALKSYTKVDDLTYDLELWDFIYDSAGNNITAEDIKWSVDYYVSLGNSGGVHRMESMEVTGKYTLRFHCNAPMGLGDLEKDFGNITVVSKAAWEASGSDEMTTKPVGTGPYVLKEYTPGSGATLEANEDFWMKNITDEAWLEANDYACNYQNVKTVRLEVIQDAASRAIALEMGTIDAADSMNAADVNIYVADPNSGIESVTLPVNPPVSWYYNCSDESPCADVNLRKAICYALDNAAIAEGMSNPAYVVYGMQPRMYDAPESWTTGREYYDYNLEKAKELVKASNYDGETLVMMYNSGTAVFGDAGVMMQSALKEIGVTLELLPAEMSVMREYTSDLTKWDLLMDTFGGGNYCNATLKKYWTEDSAKSMGGLQVTGIVDEKLDELYVALKDDNSLENIEAWDAHFTEQCYGYAIACYYNQTACRDYVNPVIVGNQNQLVPGAFTYND